MTSADNRPPVGRTVQLQLVTGALVSPEEQELAQCEAVIERGLSGFIEVGRALATIRSTPSLYKAVGYQSFEDYLHLRWPDVGGRRYADRVISATQVVENLRPIGLTLPATETQARPLTALKPDEQIEAWQRAIALADTPEHKGVMTAPLVIQAVLELKAEAAAAVAPPAPSPLADPPSPQPAPTADPPPDEHDADPPEQDNPEDPDASLDTAVEETEAPPVIEDVRSAPHEIAEFYDVATWEALPARTRQWIIEHVPSGRSTRFTRTNGNVEWALWTWNPVTGCDHGCNYCYARDIANRYYTELPDGQRFAPVFRPGRLHAPRLMRVPAAYDPEDRVTIGEKNVFVGSMTDLFGKWVPQDWIDAVFDEVVGTPDWNFLFLTKFPQRLAEQQWPENAWVGTTVDRQTRVATAERSFRGVTAGVKWLSCEPLLERLTFSSLDMFDWVVIGASSESTQTPEFQPPWEWVEHLTTQARAAGCRVYYKPNLKSRPREYPEEPAVDGRTVARLL